MWPFQHQTQSSSASTTSSATTSNAQSQPGFSFGIPNNAQLNLTPPPLLLPSPQNAFTPFASLPQQQQQPQFAAPSIAPIQPNGISNSGQFNSLPPPSPASMSGAPGSKPYSLSTDPTAMPFLRSGEEIIAQRAAELQQQGITPRAEDTRVRAVDHSGLHELVTTDKRGPVTNSGNEVMFGLQSGMRTSTSKQLFRRLSNAHDSMPVGTPEVGAHTGFATNPSGRGSTHTRGQADGHDQLRDVVDDNMNNPDVHSAANAIMIRHLEVTPPGIETLASNYMTGARPLLIGRPLGPPAAPGATQDPARLELAQDFDEDREATKDRVRGHKRKHGGTSPSPPRSPIRGDGSGGTGATAAAQPRSSYPAPEPPPIAGATTMHQAANLGGYLTHPMRRGSTSSGQGSSAPNSAPGAPGSGAPGSSGSGAPGSSTSTQTSGSPPKKKARK